MGTIHRLWSLLGKARRRLRLLPFAVAHSRKQPRRTEEFRHPPKHWAGDPYAPCLVDIVQQARQSAADASDRQEVVLSPFREARVTKACAPPKVNTEQSAELSTATPSETPSSPNMFCDSIPEAEQALLTIPGAPTEDTQTTQSELFAYRLDTEACSAAPQNCESGATILHLAVQYPSGGPLRSLLRARADVHARDGNDVTPLHVAALCGRTEAVECLLDAGADAQACAGDGSTPLHVAARSGCIEVCSALLKAKADLQDQDTSGSAALHYATDSGHMEIVEMLLEAEADCGIQDAWGRIPLHRAAFSGSSTLICTLLLHGADATILDDFGQTPLDIAVQYDNGPVAVELWKSRPACPSAADRFPAADNGLRFAADPNSTWIPQPPPSNNPAVRAADPNSTCITQLPPSNNPAVRVAASKSGLRSSADIIDLRNAAADAGLRMKHGKTVRFMFPDG